MEKCRDCNSTLKAGELTCYNCGASVVVKDAPQVIFLKRFVSFLNVAFWASALMTVGGLFVDFFPPFIRCLLLTFILLIIRSSAVQMLEKKNG